ncbi:MAG: 50S ribosomal protein L28 [Firmicutes bacterium]|nr:50S ribosomal protein L28 [Bacillota bacterium]
MARRCAVCGKGVEVGMKVSHSNRRTKRTWAPNLQRVKVKVEGRRVRLRVCARCLRSGRVPRAV